MNMFFKQIKEKSTWIEPTHVMTHYVHTKRGLLKAMKQMNGSVSDVVEGDEMSVVGLDCEWRQGDKKVSLLQLQVGNDTYLIHLSLIGWAISSELASFLLNPSLVFVGSNVKGDCTRLFNHNKGLHYRIKCIDLKQYARQKHLITPKQPFGLADMSIFCFKYDMLKGSVRVSDWSKALRKEQIRYAAIDAKMSRDVYFYLRDKRSDDKLKTAYCEQIFSKFNSVEQDEWKRAIDMPQHLDSGETNPDWINLRHHRITGSKISSVVGNNPYDSKEDFLKTMLYGYKAPKDQAPMIHGNKHEQDAEDALVKILEQDPEIEEFHITHPGIVLCRKKGLTFFGYSPDGICEIKYKDNTSEVCLLEYKAPYYKRFSGKDFSGYLYGPMSTPKMFLPDGSENPYYSQFSIETHGCTDYYYDQVQYGMRMLGDEGLLKPRTGEKQLNCLFVVWTFNVTQHFKIKHDPFYSLSLMSVAERVWRNEYVPRLLMKNRGELDETTLFKKGILVEVKAEVDSDLPKEKKRKIAHTAERTKPFNDVDVESFLKFVHK